LHDLLTIAEIVLMQSSGKKRKMSLTGSLAAKKKLENFTFSFNFKLVEMHKSILHDEINDEWYQTI
jgi:hypothetical protein